MLKRRFRLSDNKEFQFVYKNGFRAKGSFGMLVGLKNKGNFNFGIVVGKKIGNAVERNRMKRQVRSIFESFVPSLENSKISFVFVTFKKSEDFQSLKTEVTQLKDKILMNIK